MAQKNDSFKERQIEEMEVLQAVFMDDFKDLRKKDAWKVYRPPEVCLSLIPLQSTYGGEVYAKIDMIVRCPEKYPDVMPEIKLENSKGLSNQQIASLKSELENQAKEAVGEVMIYDLAQHVQNFLHLNNKPGPKSFFEEMMSNKKEKEEKEMREKQKKVDFLKKKEQKQLQQIEDEIHKRKEALKEETRKMKEARMMADMEDDDSINVTSIKKDSDPKNRSSSSPALSPRRVRKDSDSFSKGDRKRRTSTPTRDRDRSNSVEIGDHSKEHKGTSILAFNIKTERTIHRGKCLGHSARGSTVYAGMDTETGELVSIAEWVLQWRHVGRKMGVDDKEEYEKEASKYLKQVNNIEQELCSLLKLDQKNLLNYLSMKWVHDGGRIIIYVLKEFAGGGNLEMHTKKRVPVPYELLRFYTFEVLEGLTYLHNKAVTHKDLRTSCVFLEKDGAVKLADYSLDKRIADLYEMVELTRPGVHFSNLENRPATLGRSAKKADVYQLGVMLLSLALGQPVTNSLPEVPTYLPPELQDFITKCLMKDEKTRWSAFQLQEHEFVKTSLSHAAIHARKVQAAQDFLQKEGAKDQDADQSQEMPLFLRGDTSGQSRLTSEFEILEWLGKGGFGDVIKVRNQLDGRFYAIKRILLNPKSKQFNRKITREVKLLSRLNHENVVRYYNSWIETSMEPVPDDSCTSSSSPADLIQSPPHPKAAASIRNSLGFLDNIENFAPTLADASGEWSISVDVPQGGAESSSSDSGSDDDDDEDDDRDFAVFGREFLNSDSVSESDEGIIFERSNKSSHAEECRLTVEKQQANKSSEERPKAQFLYIQMEFCEKSTLRNCIDAGLYLDTNRVWRLFREIIEGLIHIHEQGMIHRDLKPVNIFLDSNDHVKIGDFGLATTDIIAKQNTALMDVTLPSTSQTEVTSSKSGSMTADGETAMTGKVGTALYVSPEVMKSATMKMHYDQKVDSYSLGIIFFEMCYRPLSTGMERVKTLSNLRQATIELPDDFDEIEMPNQVAVIRWMLQHDPVNRPTSQELLQSDYLPPPQMEEAELNEVLRSTISNPQCKAYKRMIGAMFSQPVSAADEFMFDVDIHKGSFSTHSTLIFNYVCDTMETIFKKHGAIKVTTPTLMPKNTLYDQNDQYTCFMNKSGGLVALPYDLRAPFSRYLARNNVSSLKRYSIERVYREKKLYGLHPRELTEAAVDIVTPNQGNLVPEAEVLHIIHEIIHEFPPLKDRNYYLRVNHTALMRGILMHCGIADELHNDVVTIINETKTAKHKKQQLFNRLTNVGVAEQSIESLITYIETDGSFGKVASILKSITKTKGQAGSLAKKGLHELEAILSNAEHLGVKVPAILTLGLVYNTHHFSGVVFQVVMEVPRKKGKHVLDILAAGGRYDGLIARFRMSRDLVSQTAVGASIAVDKIVAACMDIRDKTEMEIPTISDVLICTLGHRAMVKEQLHLASDLWAAGISTQVLYDTTKSLEEMQDICRDKGVSHLIVFKDTEIGSVKVQSFDKETSRTIEKKMSPQEVTEGLQRIYQAKLEESVPQTSRTSSMSSQVPSEGQTQTSHTSSHTGLPNFTITFLMPDSKLATSTKKKYESQIYAKVTPPLKQLSSKAKVFVIGVELPVAVLKTIAACLDIDGDEATYDSSISEIVEKHQRFRKYLTKIFDKIHSLKFENTSGGNSSVIIIYGLKDDCYKVLL
ncbi:eIF-2-alpha kinase GCN2-like isoform X2 [Lineus longissimus]|uniref:eIF-2-alpha kinase GCN2-like isoform X2 n=1 Tax=Lineus longissimus TaxID=88925 RepID=UPI00315CD6EF